jgi:hypothetical protein
VHRYIAPTSANRVDDGFDGKGPGTKGPDVLTYGWDTTGESAEIN